MRNPSRYGRPLYKGHSIILPHVTVYYLTSKIGTTSLQGTHFLPHSIRVTFLGHCIRSTVEPPNNGQFIGLRHTLVQW